MNRFHPQRGLTILETIIVLMIAGLIISGVWVAYAGANVNDRVARTVGVLDKTLQAARDFLMSQSAVPSTPPTGLSSALYNQGMMPADLSYKGLNTTSTLGDASLLTQVFLSPLGYDFFVQNSSLTPNAGIFNVFEIHIVFVSTANAFTAQKSCLALMPKIIGTQTLMTDRGLIGWSYGGQSSGIAIAGNTLPPQSIGQKLTPAAQATTCAAANEAVLYFGFRS